MSKILTRQEIEEKVNENNPFGTKFIYESWQPNKKEADFICGKCGEKFTRGLHNFYKSKYKICSKCTRSTQGTKLTPLNQVKKEFIDKGWKPLFTDFKNSKELLPFIDEKGYKGAITLSSLRNGSNNSPFAKYNPFALENIRRYCELNELKCKIPDQKYLGWDNRFKLICECGREFTTTFTHFIEGKHECDRCTGSQSIYEIKIENWLIANKVPYIRQYRIKELPRQPFDFFVDNKVLIEMDGEFHFRAIRMASEEQALKEYEALKQRDKIKTDFCKENNIKLIRFTKDQIINKEYAQILLNTFIKA